MCTDKLRGTCQGCGKTPRLLTKIESGQLLCRTCLREIRGPERPKHMATLEKIKELRAKGFDVSEELTKTDAQRLDLVASFRAAGFAVPQNANPAELARLGKILDLRSRGIEVSATASDSEVKTLYDSCYHVRHFFTKIADARHRNQDGSSRQRALRDVQPLEWLDLQHESENAADPCAISVKRANGEQLGYLPSETARRLLEQLQQGYRFGAYAVQISGAAPSLGLNLLILIAEAGVDDASIAAYFNRRLANNPDVLRRTGATSHYTPMPTDAPPSPAAPPRSATPAPLPPRPPVPPPPPGLARQAVPIAGPAPPSPQGPPRTALSAPLRLRSPVPPPPPPSRPIKPAQSPGAASIDADHTHGHQADGLQFSPARGKGILALFFSSSLSFAGVVNRNATGKVLTFDRNNNTLALIAMEVISKAK